MPSGEFSKDFWGEMATTGDETLESILFWAVDALSSGHDLGVVVACVGGVGS